MRGLQISCATVVADGMVVHTQSPTVKTAQDGVLELLLINHPLDCPVCDRGGECPLQDTTLAFGPGESRFVEEKRHWEKPIPISRARAARPRALHPVRPLHALRRRDRRRRADRLRRARRQHRGHHLPDEPFTLVLLRQHRADLPGRRAHRARRTASRPGRGTSSAVETSCTHLRGAVPRRARVELEPARAPARRRQRAGEPRLALRQGPLRLRGGALRGARAAARWSARAASSSSARGRRRSTPRPTGCATRSTPTARSRSRCSAARAARTRTRTSGRASPRACSAPTTSTRSSATACPAEVVLGLPDATIADLDTAAAIVVLGLDLKEELPVLFLRVRRAADGARRAAHRASRRATTASRRTRRRVVRPLPGEQGARSRSAGARSAATGRRRDGDASPRWSRVATATSSWSLGRGDLAESADATVHAAAALAALTRARFLVGAAPRQRARRARPRAHAGLPARAGHARRRAATGSRTRWGAVPDAARARRRRHPRARRPAAGSARSCCSAPTRSTTSPTARSPRAALDARRLRDRDRRVPHRQHEARRRRSCPSPCGARRTARVTNLEGRVQRVGPKVSPDGTADAGLADRRRARAAASASTSTSRPTDEVQDEIARVAPAFAGVDARAAAPRARRRGAADRRPRRRARARPVSIPLTDASWEPIRPGLLDGATASRATSRAADAGDDRAGAEADRRRRADATAVPRAAAARLHRVDAAPATAAAVPATPTLSAS